MLLDLDDEQAFAADNDATVRAFWEQAAPELELDDQFIVEAVARARGNLQHAAMLRLQLASLPAELRRIEDILRGLAALLARAWERIAAEPVVVDGLGILCAAREALTLDELSAVAAWAGAVATVASSTASASAGNLRDDASSARPVGAISHRAPAG